MLVILKNCNHCSAYGQARTVKRVHEAALLGGRRLEADRGPAGLEILEIGAGRDLPVLVLSRQPDLDVVGLGRGEAQVAGAERDHPVVQAELLQDALGVAEELFQLII